MTAVLTAFRSNEEKVAAAVAECRRMGIEVLPPDVHKSHLEFTVEGDAIRFGLLAVKNVGQGAIESIIAARDEGGEFRSLTDFCTRIDLRLANRKVLEALAKVGALSPFGHPAQILLGLDDAVAAAQATQRDRITGQTSLFDLGAAEASALERPLPTATEVPVRERLRWEKELLGLYLSEHPMGEVAEHVGRFVTAYSSDLRDESLDGQRVVVGGIVTGVRTVITKAKATMAIVTLEDLQGTIEVVVFPRLYEQTDGHVARRRDPAGRRSGRPQERGGLVAGRPRRRVGCGRGRPARRPSRGRWRPAIVAGGAAGGRRPTATAAGDMATRRAEAVPTGGRPLVPVGPGQPVGVTAGGGAGRRGRRDRGRRPGDPVRLAAAGRRRARRGRAGRDAAPADRARPNRSRPTPIRRASRQGPDQDDEPSVPDEARARIVADATADAPVDAGPGTILHVRFAGSGRARSRGRGDGDVQGRAARPAGRDPGRHPRAGLGRRRGTAHGAAPRRRLRRRAARRGAPPAGRRPRRTAPRQRLTAHRARVRRRAPA